MLIMKTSTNFNKNYKPNPKTSLTIKKIKKLMLTPLITKIKKKLN